MIDRAKTNCKHATIIMGKQSCLQSAHYVCIDRSFYEKKNFVTTTSVKKKGFFAQKRPNLARNWHFCPLLAHLVPCWWVGWWLWRGLYLARHLFTLLDKVRALHFLLRPFSIKLRHYREMSF